MGRTADALRRFTSAPTRSLALEHTQLVWDSECPSDPAELTGIALVRRALKMDLVATIKTGDTGLIYIDARTGNATLVNEDPGSQRAISVEQCSNELLEEVIDGGAQFSDSDDGFVCIIEGVSACGVTRQEAGLRALVKSHPIRTEKRLHLLRQAELEAQAATLASESDMLVSDLHLALERVQQQLAEGKSTHQQNLAALRQG